MIEAEQLGVVWNQNKGRVQVLANEGAMVLDLSQDEARALANHLLSAARIPDVARRMATTDDKVPTLREIISDGAAAHAVMAENEAVYTGVGGPIGGSMADGVPQRWHPDTARDDIVRASYAE